MGESPRVVRGLRVAGQLVWLIEISSGTEKAEVVIKLVTIGRSFSVRTCRIHCQRCRR